MWMFMYFVQYGLGADNGNYTFSKWDHIKSNRLL